MRKVPVLVISSLLLTGAGVGVQAEAAVHPSAKIASGPRLKVNLASGRHAISRYIYGMNFAGTKLERMLRLPVVRWGGNATTRYNYLLDTANHASDWYFENIPNPVANPKALPNGSSADRFIGQNRADGAASLITVPLIGWTPKSRALSCGFSIKKYGKQQASDPYNPNCGNGVRSNGSFVHKNLPGDTSKRIGAELRRGLGQVPGAQVRQCRPRRGAVLRPRQ